MKLKKRYKFMIAFLFLIGAISFFGEQIYCYLDFQMLKMFRRDQDISRMIVNEICDSKYGVKLALKDANIYGGRTRGWSSSILTKTELDYAEERMKEIIQSDAPLSKKVEMNSILLNRTDDLGYLLNIFDLVRYSGQKRSPVMMGRSYLNRKFRIEEVYDFQLNEDPDVDIEMTREEFAALIEARKLKYDLATLRELCNVPPEVIGCKWQTREFGNDWNLIAELEFDQNSSEVLNGYLTKVKPEKSFCYNTSLPEWIVNLDIFETDSTGWSRYIGSEEFMYEPDYFAKGVLIHGFVLKLSETKLLLYLFTM